MLFPDAHAATAPEQVAYRLGEVEVTYAELVDTSIRVANLLRAHGVGFGDSVALLLPNMVGTLDVTFACQRSGLRYTAISTGLTASEVAYIVEDCGARVLVTAAAMLEVARAAVAELDGDVAVWCWDGSADADGALPPAVDLRELLPQQPAEPTGPECEGVDLLYSSGTTGRPKGVATPLAGHPLGTPWGSAPFLIDTWGMDTDTVYLSPAPLYHSAPLRFCQTVLRCGGSVIVMERFDAEEALRLIERHRVTHTKMVPTMFVRMLQLPDRVRERYDLSSLRAVIHAAAPCPPSVKRRMIEWVGPIVDEFYSSTENALMTLVRSHEALERPGTVGRPILGTPHILDDSGRELPVGETGTIWSEGGLDFTYLNDPAKTAASRNEQGWRTVGDLGYVDADGYVYLSDRRADLVLVGGVNVYPQEAENVLIEHPAIRDAAVYGVPDPEYGQRVHATVQLRDGFAPSADLEEELLDFCRARLARVKCPRAVDVVEEMPRTPTGKLLKRVLRDRFPAHG